MQTCEGAYIHGYSSVRNCLMFFRGWGWCGVGRLGGVAWAMILEGMGEASRRKFKWGLLQTGQLKKPRESKKSRHGEQV